MIIIERVARALAGNHFSRNAEGAAPAGVPASDLVERHWRDYVDDAVAVLKTMREADPAMIPAGERAAPQGIAAIWEAMIRAAVDEERMAGQG